MEFLKQEMASHWDTRLEEVNPSDPSPGDDYTADHFHKVNLSKSSKLLI